MVNGLQAHHVMEWHIFIMLKTEILKLNFIHCYYSILGTIDTVLELSNSFRVSNIVSLGISVQKSCLNALTLEISGDSPDHFGIVSGHEPRRQTKPPLPCVVRGWRINRGDKNLKLATPIMKYEIMQKISSLAVSDCGQYIGIGCHNGDVQCLSSRKLNLIQRNVL